MQREERASSSTDTPANRAGEDPPQQQQQPEATPQASTAPAAAAEGDPPRAEETPVQAPQRQARPPEQPVATSKAPPPGIGPPLAPSNESEHSWPSEDDRNEREQREQRQRSRSRDRPTTIGAAPTAATSHHPHYHRSSQARPPQQGPQRRHRGLGRVGKTPCGHSLCFNPQQPPAAWPPACRPRRQTRTK